MNFTGLLTQAVTLSVFNVSPWLLGVLAVIALAIGIVLFTVHPTITYVDTEGDYVIHKEKHPLGKKVILHGASKNGKKLVGWSRILGNSKAIDESSMRLFRSVSLYTIWEDVEINSAVCVEFNYMDSDENVIVKKEIFVLNTRLPETQEDGLEIEGWSFSPDEAPVLTKEDVKATFVVNLYPIFEESPISNAGVPTNNKAIVDLVFIDGVSNKKLYKESHYLTLALPKENEEYDNFLGWGLSQEGSVILDKTGAESIFTVQFYSKGEYVIAPVVEEKVELVKAPEEEKPVEKVTLVKEPEEEAPAEIVEKTAIEAVEEVAEVVEEPIAEPANEETPAEEAVEEAVEEVTEEAPAEEEPALEAYSVVEEATEEAPAEEAVEEAPVEEAVEEAPAEEAAQEAPVEEAVEEAPVEETVEEAPAEETVEEAPVEEAPAEETPVIENYSAEEPVQETSVDAIIVPTYFDNEGNKIDIKYSRSITANIIQSEDTVKGYYNELKNHILSYKGVKSRISWKFDSYNRGRDQLFKIKLRGKTICLYCALDPEEFDKAKYHHEAVDAKIFADVPMLVKVKSGLGLRKAKELVDIEMAKFEIEKNPKAKEVDYLEMYPYEENEPLLERGLIKVLVSDENLVKKSNKPVEEEAPVVENLSVVEEIQEEAPAEEAVVEVAPAEEAVVEEASAEETVVEEAPAEETVVEEAPAEETAQEAPAEEAVVEEAPVEETAQEAPVVQSYSYEEEDVVYEEHVVIVDEVTAEEADQIAEEQHIDVHVEEGVEYISAKDNKKAIINVDTLSDAFEAHQVADLASMKAKGIIDKRAKTVKVLARGSINKPLIVKAGDFSRTAIEMILLTGGNAVHVEYKVK